MASQGDLTGRRRGALAKQHEAELKKRADELGMINQEKATDDRVGDYSVGSEPELVDEVEVSGVDIADEWRVMRAAEDVNQMCVGYGNYYTFESGRKYKVPKQVYDHCLEKGLVSAIA